MKLHASSLHQVVMDKSTTFFILLGFCSLVALLTPTAVIFIIVRDTHKCSSSPCHNNATCTDIINDYTCKCLPGYSGKNCETGPFVNNTIVVVDVCASTPCQNSGVCTSNTNSYNCSCLPGYSGTNCETASTTCKTILAADASAPTGEYIIVTSIGRKIKVYCEMGLHGGGYTFINPMELSKLVDSEIQSMFNDTTAFLMEAQWDDGTQHYGVLTQLSQFAYIPLMIGLNQNTGYNHTQNENVIGLPYLYFGFIPTAKSIKSEIQGIIVNDSPVTFTNCDGVTNSYISLFPNFHEITPSSYKSTMTYLFCNTIFSKLKRNPSTRNMPEEYFVLGELHFGGCGCYTSTDRYLAKSVLSITIGFR